MQELLANPIIWLLIAIITVPFMIPLIIEAIYRRNHDEALEYEYTYRDADFNDGTDNADVNNWKITEDVIETGESDPR